MSKTKAKKKTVALNIRVFPPDLLWACRITAAEQKMTMREFVIQTLQAAVQKKGKAHGD